MVGMAKDAALDESGDLTGLTGSVGQLFWLETGPTGPFPFPDRLLRPYRRRSSLRVATNFPAPSLGSRPVADVSNRNRGLVV